MGRTILIVLLLPVLLAFFLLRLIPSFKTPHLVQPKLSKQTSSSALVENPTPIKSPSPQKFDHIILLVMENKGSSEIVGNSKAPFINSLIKNYSLALNYLAVSHPSLPNYLALIGGETFGIDSDCTNCFISSKNFVDQLEEAHLSWKAYMESYPSPCFIGDSPPYAQKHNPFIYFDDIRLNPDRCQKIVSLTELFKDLNGPEAPNFIWITPNLCNDMHDCSISTGDSWLSEEIPVILKAQGLTNSLLIITWDEAEGFGENKVPTIFIGEGVKKGYLSTNQYNHYSLLHTLEENWNLPPLTDQVKISSVMDDLLLNSF